jgi:large subunit ribosomal protein L9
MGRGFAAGFNMQIILLEKIVNLGQLGEVVRVKDGYARNFLIPSGKAKRATDAAIKEFEVRRTDLERVHAERLQAAQVQGERLQGLTLQIAAKAGVDGRLFGSVTNYDVSEALGKQGFDVPKASIRLPLGPLKTVGDHKISISLHSDVVVEITVSVLGEHV